MALTKPMWTAREIMEVLDGIDHLYAGGQHDEAFMPSGAFGRAGDARHPVLTRPTGRNGLLDFTARPAIRLYRMALTCDMIEQLGLSIYVESLDRLESERAIAWIKYDLPTRENPFRFTLRKTYGDPRLLDMHTWENLGMKIIREIMQETGYNVGDVSYRFCDEVRDHFTELYRVAGGATMMAHCARERDCIVVDSLAEVMGRLSRIFIEYEDVLLFF